MESIIKNWSMQERKNFISAYNNLVHLEEELQTKKRPMKIVEEIYSHDAKDYLNRLKGVQFLSKDGLEDIDYFNSIKQELPLTKYVSSLHPILDIGDFTKQSLQDTKGIKIYSELQKQMEIINQVYGVKANISGDKISTPYNYYSIAIAILTNSLDSTKWTPDGEIISASCWNGREGVKVTLENKVREKPRPNIGLGEGIGSKYTNQLMETIGGRMTTQKYLEHGEKMFRKELIFPNK